VTEEITQTAQTLPTVAVNTRCKSLHIDSLGMKCDAKEIPDPLKAAASYLNAGRLTLKDVVKAKSNQSRWIALGRFVGKARNASTTTTEEVATEADQPIAMTVVETEGRLLGIVAPRDNHASAIWWAWPLSSISVTAHGSQGTFKKRPTHVSLVAYGSCLDLREISYVRNDKSSFTPGREIAFLRALGTT